MRSATAATLLLAMTATIGLSADTPDVPAFAKEVPAIKTGEPLLTFNGKDLTGFYVYTKPHGYADPNGVVTVNDGMIRVSGQDYGGFVTGGNFRDYHLVAEFKWGDKAWPPRVGKTRDSGVLLHCVGADGAAGGQWMESIECQLIEGGCGDFILVGGRNRPTMSCEIRVGPDKQLYYEKGGELVTRNSARYNWWGRDPAWKDVRGFRGSRDVEKPAGEWNRLEVICDGDTITNIINGYVVNVGTKCSLTEGKIMFQSEGAELFFRKIEVRPLKK